MQPWSTLVWRGPRPGLVKRLCEDSCSGFTRNGVCDEGRPTLAYRALWRRQQDPAQSVYQVHCDLGTDCGDCGTWVRPPHRPAAQPTHTACAADARALPPCRPAAAPHTAGIASVISVSCDISGAALLAHAPLQYHTNSHESDAWRPIRDLRKLDANVSGLVTTAQRGQPGQGAGTPA